jgi:hypothetical protein
MCSTSLRVSVAICTFGTMLEIVPFFADDFSPMKKTFRPWRTRLL